MPHLPTPYTPSSAYVLDACRKHQQNDEVSLQHCFTSAAHYRSQENIM